MTALERRSACRAVVCGLADGKWRLGLKEEGGCEEILIDRSQMILKVLQVAL